MKTWLRTHGSSNLGQRMMPRNFESRLKKSPRILDTALDIRSFIGPESAQTSYKVHSHLMPETLQRSPAIIGCVLAVVFAAIQQLVQIALWGG